jgi:hypothetical protein
MEEQTMPEEAGDAGVLDTAAVMDFFANNGDAEPATDDTTVDPAVDAAQQDEQTPVESPLGPIPDLSDLDPDARAIVQKRISDFQRSYTEKTTKLADAQRILEGTGTDPEAILEAYQFQQLLSDPGPEGDDARARLYQALNAQYGTQPQQQAPTPETPEDPFSEYDLPPEIRDALSMVPQLKAQLDQFTATQQEYAQQQAQQAYLQEVVDDLQGKWGSITTERPDLSDAEDAIFALAASTDGNLLAAVDLYDSIERKAQAKLFAGSANVPGGSVSPPAGGGHSTEPVVLEDFKQAGKAAEEFLRRAYLDQ